MSSCRATNAKQSEPSRGGEPAIVRRIRDAIGHWEDTGNHVAFGYSMQELRDLLAFIDRPSPAASVPSEQLAEALDTVQKMHGILEDERESKRDAEQERDRLKARVEELEREVELRSAQTQWLAQAIQGGPTLDQSDPRWHPATSDALRIRRDLVEVAAKSQAQATLILTYLKGENELSKWTR